MSSQIIQFFQVLSTVPQRTDLGQLDTLQYLKRQHKVMDRAFVGMHR
jgi:hypothetical protein